MADSDKFIDHFLQDQDDLKDTWTLYAINPFSSAYEDALGSYKDTLKEQEDADKAAAERKFQLMMLALSLCGGGLMTAAFGTTVMKSIASDAAINVICRNNMERAFKVAHVISTNKTAGFIAGTLWDEAEKRLTDAVSDKLKGSMAQDASNFPSTQQVGAVKMKNTLENFVLEAKVKAAALAKGIRDDPKLDADTKIAEVTKLAKSKFFTPPKKSVDDGNLSDEIELSFYMKLVLDSDYLETYTGSWEDAGGARMRWRGSSYQHPIETSAYSQDYPQDRSGLGKSDPNRQSVGYKDIGSVIANRMNKLHRQKFHSDFFDGELDTGIMWKAEQTMGLLANSNINRLIKGV